jgi:hypothetical protein
MSSPNTYLPSKILVATNKYHNHQPLITLISSKEKKTWVWHYLQKFTSRLSNIASQQTDSNCLSLATIKSGMNADQAALIPI